MNTLSQKVAERLTEIQASLSLAESCSGGLIAHIITNVPGASTFFFGGIVSYSNNAKQSLLGVAHDTLVAHGAVSEPVARAMAEGARRAFGTDYAVGVTGVAGPAGGTPEKPVGLVYIAVATPRSTMVTRNQFSGTREAVKEMTAKTALTLLLEQLR